MSPIPSPIFKCVRRFPYLVAPAGLTARDRAAPRPGALRPQKKAGGPSPRPARDRRLDEFPSDGGLVSVSSCKQGPCAYRRAVTDTTACRRTPKAGGLDRQVLWLQIDKSSCFGRHDFATGSVPPNGRYCSRLRDRGDRWGRRSVALGDRLRSRGLAICGTLSPFAAVELETSRQVPWPIGAKALAAALAVVGSPGSGASRQPTPIFEAPARVAGPGRQAYCSMPRTTWPS